MADNQQDTTDRLDDITGPEAGGNPTTGGLTAGGTGMALEGGPDSGGDSGGGVLDRIGGIETTGGTSDGTLGGTSVGAGIPPKPNEDIDLDGAP